MQVHLLKVLLAILLADGDVIGDGQLLRLDDIVLGNNHHALHHIVQLPDIAGPVVALHADDGLRGEALFLVIFLVHFGGIGRHNVGNILPALPQRRYIDGQHAQGIVQVLPELLFPHQGQQVSAGGSDNSQVTGLIGAVAQRLYLPPLDG